MPRGRPRANSTAPAPAARRGRRRNASPSVLLSRKLALNQWLLGLFGADSFDRLAEHLKDESLEGLDTNNVHRFHHALCLHLPRENRPELTDDLLLEYDQAIVSVTQRLNEVRITRGEKPIVWKYFQYLALLFTEIYLDRYFRDPAGLRSALNARIEHFNADLAEADRIALLDEAGDPRLQLNKVAFWMATGSGKTLLMHANILQYRRHLETHGRTRDLNRIILLTPNEGLSKQHLRDFQKSGIDAEMFNKDGRGLFAGSAVEILDINKLREETGDKTVSVDAFEGNNLVLVDEGHRGASSGSDGTWMTFRNALCEKGFSFEYSATFGQAVSRNRDLTGLYARSILFDYSYRWFHQDGFGKDYRILNLQDGRNEEWMKSYLTACLLAFFQQQRLYRENESDFRPFNIEKPLWVFVGGSVNAVRTENREQVSDVVAILKFLADYVEDRKTSIDRIQRILSEGLTTASGQNLFSGRFPYLNSSGMSPEQIFDETLSTIFNAPKGGSLHVENIKGAPGEIAVRLGDNDPFGLINVGDASKLVKLCEEKGIDVADREFSGSLFHEINEPHSTINVLIGSKKFTEGWDSWRVSTMGLMNIGRSEGAQIIQLFGRGVRLKGYDISLKRSAAARALLPSGLEPPKHIELLETLHIFGIRADYMAQFRKFLEEEGLSPDEERTQIIVPVIRNLGGKRLKTIRIKKKIGDVVTDSRNAFRKLGPVPTVQPPRPAEPATTYLQKNKVVLNWYPKIRAMESTGMTAGGERTGRNETHLSEEHIAFLDLDRLYFDLERFKAERGWYNLNVTRAGISALLADPRWYTLLIPQSELAFDSFENTRLWQEIAQVLLRKYVERYYAFRRNEWELPHLEYQELTENDPNFTVFSREGTGEYGYRVLIEKSQDAIVEKLNQLKDAIGKGELKDCSFNGLKAISFDRHLYQPLLCLEGGGIEISPVPLNEGERQFVEDLKAFYKDNPSYFAGREVYLLRNLSKGRGVGFFEAGNFHPDFIIWQLEGSRQRVTFVDPKGILHADRTDPKFTFYQTIKEIEKRLGDSDVVLESFIVSNTPSYVMERRWGLTKEEMLQNHILFQKEDKGTYIRTLLVTTS